jgi:hypothetical protein
MATTAAGAPASGRAQGKNLLTQKFGPLPVWGWLAIVTALAAGVYLLTKKKSSTDSGTTGTSQIPETIIQNVMPTETQPAPAPPPPGATPPSPPPVTVPPLQPPPTQPPTVLPNQPPPPAKQGGGGTPPPRRPAGLKTITVGGPHATKDLYQLARQYGISEARLIQINPNLKRYEGSGKPIPTKTKIKIPA